MDEPVKIGDFQIVRKAEYVNEQLRDSRRPRRSRTATDMYTRSAYTKRYPIDYPLYKLWELFSWFGEVQFLMPRRYRADGEESSEEKENEAYLACTVCFKKPDSSDNLRTYDITMYGGKVIEVYDVTVRGFNELFVCGRYYEEHYHEDVLSWVD